MRAVVQRVSKASVSINSTTTARIGKGLVVLLGIGPNDGPAQIAWMCDKIVHLRIFNDAEGKMNLSCKDIGGEVLMVSQFTLYGDCRKGRRPGYSGAAPPASAEQIYHLSVATMREMGVPVATGTFQAHMEVDLVNDGPVTLLLDSDKLF